jgi:hypothetical protein
VWRRFSSIAMTGRIIAMPPSIFVSWISTRSATGEVILISLSGIAPLLRKVM